MYVINKTDGTIAATVQDGVVDTTYTNLYLVGKNYNAYGVLINDNFVRLLENFASNTAPTKPLKGQVWWNNLSSQLFVYDGSHFKNINAVAVKNTSPDIPATGDLWYDTVNKQLKHFVDPTWTTVSPMYTLGQKTSGPIVETINLIPSGNATVTKYYNGGDIIAVHANASVSPNPAIPGYGQLRPGINLGTGYKLYGTATNSELFGNAAPDKYLRSDQDIIVRGQLTITSDLGIVLGSMADLKVNVDLNGVNIVSTQPDVGLNIYTTNDQGSNVNAISIAGDGTTLFSRDVYANNFYAVMDVVTDGNANVNTDLTVAGNTYVNDISAANVDAAFLTITNDISANNLILDSTLTSNDVAANIAYFGTGDVLVAQPTESLVLDGDLGLQSTDTIWFRDTNTGDNSYISGDAGRLILGTQDQDAITIGALGLVEVAVELTSPVISSPQIQSGHLVIASDIITTTKNNGDVGIAATGDGYVVINQAIVENDLTVSRLNIASDLQSTSYNTGALVLTGGLGVSKDINVAGNLNALSMLSTTAAKEKVQIIGSALSGPVNVDLLTGSVKYYSAAAAGNWIPNFRGTDVRTLNSLLSVGESITCTMITTQGATPYYTSTATVDGAAVTLKWLAFNPDAGDGNSLDVYSYALIKTGTNQWMVLAGLSNFV